MPTVQVNARIDRTLKETLDRYCRKHGVVMNHFIQEAILDRLEELEDIEETQEYPSRADQAILPRFLMRWHVASKLEVRISRSADGQIRRIRTSMGLRRTMSNVSSTLLTTWEDPKRQAS